MLGEPHDITRYQPEQAIVPVLSDTEKRQNTEIERAALTPGARLAHELSQLETNPLLDKLRSFLKHEASQPLVRSYAELSLADRQTFFIEMTNTLEQIRASEDLLPYDLNLIEDALGTFAQISDELPSEHALHRTIANAVRANKLQGLHNLLLEFESDPPDPEDPDQELNEWYSLTPHGRTSTLAFVRNFVAQLASRRYELAPDQIEALDRITGTVIPYLEKSNQRQIEANQRPEEIDWNNRSQAIQELWSAMHSHPSSEPSIGGVRSPSDLADRAITHFGPGESRPLRFDINRIVGTQGLDHSILQKYMKRLITDTAQAEGRKNLEVHLLDRGQVEVITTEFNTIRTELNTEQQAWTQEQVNRLRSYQTASEAEKPALAKAASAKLLDQTLEDNKLGWFVETSAYLIDHTNRDRVASAYAELADKDLTFTEIQSRLAPLLKTVVEYYLHGPAK